MNGPLRISVLGRREFLTGAGAAAALLALARPAGATEPLPSGTPQPNPQFEAALDKILGDAKPVSGKIAIEMPEIAENGNTVPYSISIDSPMTVEDHVRAIHVLAGANPAPNVASFRLTPLAGKAAVQSRMRLAKTQPVVILAELSSGKFITARQTVKVTIGGCGG